MNKFLALLKSNYTKCSNRRKENVKIYGKHSDNAVNEVINDYIGKVLLTLLFALAVIKLWPDKAGNFEIFQMLIPMLVIFWIFIINGIEYTLITTLIFLRKQEFWLAQLVLRFHNRITHPLNNALSANIFGVILGNLILLTTLYNRNWQKFINVWQTNHKIHTYLIMQIILFFITTVIIPYFFCMVSIALSRMIHIYDTININEQI